MNTVDGSRSVNAGLKVADAVWVATAELHHRYPEAPGFSPASIREEVLTSRLTDKDQKSVYQHIIQHLLANKPKDPNGRKMLTEVGDGLRRLYIAGDPFHPSKKDGRSTPKPEDLPPSLRHWLSWYENWSRNHPGKREPSPALDPLEALAGTWTFGDADTFVRELRKGWE
ncbi:MAG: hypothetical protein ABR910_16295 [Acidobacteriaceae bacterium]|jgi:hypothetical protein